MQYLVIVLYVVAKPKDNLPVGKNTSIHPCIHPGTSVVKLGGPDPGYARQHYVY